jgi:hypothetical protein
MTVTLGTAHGKTRVHFLVPLDRIRFKESAILPRFEVIGALRRTHLVFPVDTSPAED